MSVDAVTLPAGRRRLAGTAHLGELGGGALALAYLSLLVVVPLVAVVAKGFEDGLGAFVESITSDQSLAALKLTVAMSAAVVAINVVMGTLIAWVLVRDDFRGKGFVDALIDLPFALPTIVAGLTLLALYGPTSPVGVNAGFTRAGVLLALLFVTLPFVVRAVQPVLLALDRDMEDAAASLGARPVTTFRRVVLPNLGGAISAGAGLAFARALGEFGSVVLISGNLPYKTEVASVFIYGRIENGDTSGAAAVSVLLLVVSLVLLLAIGTFARREERRG